MFVYVIVNCETLKIYIGQHKGDNLRKYMQQKLSHANHKEAARSHLYAAMRKYPKTVWSIHPLISVQTKVECDYYERKLIAALNTRHHDVGYNICRGGEGFTGPHTVEWKQKQSARMMGHGVSLETRAKLSIAGRNQKGQKRPPSSQRLEQLRKQMLGNKLCVGRHDARSPLSAEHKQKISSAMCTRRIRLCNP